MIDSVKLLLLSKRLIEKITLNEVTDCIIPAKTVVVGTTFVIVVLIFFFNAVSSNNYKELERKDLIMTVK